jgi:hypothetical protein
MTETNATRAAGTPEPACSALHRDRIMLLHEAICRCSTCRGTTDKHRLCRVCVGHDQEIDRLQNTYSSSSGKTE